MKCKVIGVTRMSGVSKKNGSPYDFTVIRAIVPATTERTEKMTKESYGFEVAEIRATEQVVDQLSRAKFPCDVTLSMSHELNRFRQMETVAVGATIDGPAAVGSTKAA